MFIGREQELRFFEDKYNAPGGQLVVLYGRRRIGKTELLHEFAKGKPHVFYSCREITDGQQLAAFSERLLNADSPAAKYISVFADWEAAFKAFRQSIVQASPQAKTVASSAQPKENARKKPVQAASGRKRSSQ